MAGDRGMITNTRIADLHELPGMDWITAPRAPAIAALASADGSLQTSLFDTQNFAEITYPDYPGERLICCRNPVLAADRARKREALLAATEKDLEKVRASVNAGRLNGAGAIGERAVRSSAGTRSPGNSSLTSPAPASLTGATRRRSPPRPPTTGYT
jgi:hypothetical protein